MKKTKKFIAIVACIVICFTVAVVPCFAYSDATQTLSETTNLGGLSSIWDAHPTGKKVWYRSHYLSPVSTSFGPDGITFHVPTSEIPLWDYWFYLADVGFQGSTTIKQTFAIDTYLPNLYFHRAVVMIGNRAVRLNRSAINEMTVNIRGKLKV